MYSVLLSKIEYVFSLIKNRLKEIVNENMRVVVLPWAFPTELDYDRLINEYFKEGSMVKPVISGVLTSYLENSVNNTQSQALISLSQSEKIARINKYSDQRISPSALLEELDSSLSYGKTPKYTIEEATLRQELDNCYRKIRKLQEETVRVAKYNTILEEKNKQIISGIKTNCSDTTFYKILVPSGMWQLPIGVDISNQKSDREIIEEFGENAKTNKTTLKLK